jgi:putative membrane protein
MWMGQHMYGLGWEGWIVGGLIMLLFWGGLIALVFFAIRAFSGSGSRNAQTNTGETALGILKKRYARGEISKEEYDSIRQDLDT